MRSYSFVLIMLICGSSLAEPLKVATLTVQRAAQPHRALLGTVIAPHRQFITSEIIGVVSSQRAEMGTRVDAGDILITIDSADREASVSLAEADVEVAAVDVAKAQLAYQRAESSFQHNVIAQAIYDNAGLDLKKANANLRRAMADLAREQLLLQKHEIRAPFSGSLATATPVLGKYVSPGENLVELVDISNRRIEVLLAPEEVVHVSSGRYWIGVSGPDGIERLSFAAISPIADRQTGMSVAELLLPTDALERRTGQLARLQIYITGHADIPKSGIRQDELGAYVLVVENERATRKELGAIESGHHVIVMSAPELKPGDPVISISLDSES